jgi:hypothetical protein
MIERRPSRCNIALGATRILTNPEGGIPMTRFTIAATLALAAAFPAAAQATLLTRTFVSSAGSNSNPCTITQPCATFAVAYGLTAPNGIITALDPGKYGPVTITGPVTINGNGWAAITGPASDNAITINAVSGNVALIGLEVDGAGAAFNGIVFNSGSSLTVTNCVIQNFHNDGTAPHGTGILIQPTTGTLAFTITNTNVSNNGNDGILYQPPSGTPSANGVIDHVVATSNDNNGINFNTSNTTGGATVATTSNSIASNNTNNGINAQNSPSGSLRLSIDNASISGNAGYGVSAASTSSVLLGRSVIMGNSNGVINTTSPNTFFTYKDNRINSNEFFDINGSGLNTSLLPQ